MRELEVQRVPTVSATEMREVDRVMIEDLGIELMQMMENAGRSLAQLALSLFSPASVVVLVGPGGNGGGGLVAARHLANRGVGVQAVLSHPADRWAPVPAHQARIVERMGISTSADPAVPDLVIDALLGYSLEGDPRGRSAELIEWSNRSGAPILSLDTPSGLDVTTGEALTPCIRATATMTLALPKTGLIGAEQVGDLYVADISVPPSVYESMGLGVVDLFGSEWLIRLV
jgi:NAD(P)H-hydrate epimerase